MDIVPVLNALVNATGLGGVAVAMFWLVVRLLNRFDIEVARIRQTNSLDLANLGTVAAIYHGEVLSRLGAPKAEIEELKRKLKDALDANSQRFPRVDSNPSS